MSRKEIRPNSLIDEFFRIARLPKFWTIALIGAVLVVPLVLIIYIEVQPTSGDAWDFWRNGIEPTVIIIYILIIYPLLQRLHYRALETFRPLLSKENGAFDRLVTDISSLNRRREWAAVLIGIAFLVVVGQPWNWESKHGWFTAYIYITDMLEFGLLGLLIYIMVSSTLKFSQLSRIPLNLDIFQPGQLTPVALRSLGISIAIIGGTSLSLIFQTGEELVEVDNIVIYSILVFVTVLIFFHSMWSTHRAMAEAKKRELDIARNHLVLASRELKEKGTQGQFQGIGELHSAVAAWVTYEKRVQEAREWPYDASVIRRLVAAIPIPGIVYIIKVFLFGT
jgi:hypothetical protein